MITTAEAAAALQVTRRRVLELIRLGTLKAGKFGRDWQVDPESVDEYKNSPRKAGRKSKPEVNDPHIAHNIAHNIAHSEDRSSGDSEDGSD